MKTAKEWAAEMVDLCDHPDVEEYRVDIGDHHAFVSVVCDSSEDAMLRRDTATGIIERLVERVQADARAPLEEEIARLRAENDRLNAEHVEYLAFIAVENDTLAKEHDQIRKANGI